MHTPSSVQNSSFKSPIEHSGYDGKNSVLRWTPFNFREYLESREGRVWQYEDTVRMLDRAEQIDALVEQLMRAAGIEIVE